MINYESSQTKNLASLMLKRQHPVQPPQSTQRQSPLYATAPPSYSPKLVNNESERERRVFGKNYSLYDEYGGGGGIGGNNRSPGITSSSRASLSPGRSSYPNVAAATHSRYPYNESNAYNPRESETTLQRSSGIPVRMTTTTTNHDTRREHHHLPPPPYEELPVRRDDEPTAPVPKPPKKEINRDHLTRMRKKYKNKITANIAGTKFEIVRHVLESIGCKILPDDNFDCNLIWDDTKVSIEGISELKSFQRYNHFPAMSEISKKDALARNMAKISKLLPKEFDFVPRTWIMPTDYSSLLTYALETKKNAFAQQKPNRTTFIMKPANGAMGHGIKLFRNVEKIQPIENFIVQEYIPNPYLIDGFKFDLRIYALVTSCDPLRAFIYNNGLVRLGTEEYQEPHESNIDHLFMHLTNYSVNKRNRNNYDEGDEIGEKGTKRSLKFLFEHLRRNNIDSAKVWRNIQDIILKTLLVSEPYLFHTYKMCRPGQIAGTESVCFEILGFDILIDDTMKPWVIEVNRSPSFGANQQIDFDIKSRLLFESFELLHLRASDRMRHQVMEKAESKRRLYNLNTVSSRADMISSSLNHYESNKPMIHSVSSSNLLSSMNSPKKFKTKERRKAELIDQIKLMRREQKRQEYENRNLGNYSRLFPKSEKTEMDYYLSILNTAFNLFYPVGKHLQWKKTYEKIKEDELLSELAECDDTVYDNNNYDQIKKMNEYLRDDYMSTESESQHSSSSEDEDNNIDRKRSQLTGHTSSNHRHHRDDYDSSRRYNEPVTDSRGRRLHGYDEPPPSHHPHLDIPPSALSTDRKKETTRSLIEQQAIRSNRVTTLINAMAMPSTSSMSQSHHGRSSSLTNSNNSGASKTNPTTNSWRMLTRVVAAKQQNQQQRSESTSDLNNAEMNSRLAMSLINEIRAHQAKQSTASVADVLSNNVNITVKTAKGSDNQKEEVDTNNIAALNVAVLKLLTQLEIKYPGKSNEDTRALLHKIYTKFEVYKPKLANYWMAKLDDNKRIKILNIVKSNFMAILRKVFMLEAVENLRLYKIFVKLLNRMLWMHGQGLWNCFISNNNASWECIFSKSSFQITESELKCCYRLVQLCKDCVLIVYQYAFEQKPNQTPVQNQHQHQNHQHHSNTNGATTTNRSRFYLNSASMNRVEI